MHDFDELYCCHRKTLHRYLYSLCKDWCLAEDLVQETFMKVYINRHRLPVVQYPLIWLRTIARNSYVDYVRKQRIHMIPFAEIENIAAVNSSNIDTYRVELNVFIMETIHNRLSYAMFSDYLYGYDLDQLSLKYACSLSAVKTRIYRTKKLVQLQWNKC